jgi:ubiquitin carboxyl-terminal hydrolase 48
MKKKAAVKNREKKTTNVNYEAIAKSNVVCNETGHGKENCADNPWCLHKLNSKGIWKSTYSSPTNLNKKLGNNPSVLSRVLEDTSNTIILKPCGLQNLGNTCYLNVIIQMWYHNSLIRDALFSMQYDEKKTDTIDNIVYAVQDAFGHLDQCEKGSFNLSNLTGVLELDISIQQDPDELSNLLMAKLEECKLPLKTSDVCNIKELTTGKQKIFTICQICDERKSNVEQFRNLPIIVNSSPTDLMSAYLTHIAEEIGGKDVKLFCQKCERDTNFRRKIEIISLPPVLTLNIQRYIYDKEKRKKTKTKYSLTFPSEINIAKEQFVLTAVLYHKVRIYLFD